MFAPAIANRLDDINGRLEQLEARLNAGGL
jgi:hypothetical protein